MSLLRVKADLRGWLRRQNHHSLISWLFPSFSVFSMQIITLFTPHNGHFIYPSGWWKSANSCLYADLIRRWLQGKGCFVIKTYSFLLNILFNVLSSFLSTERNRQRILPPLFNLWWEWQLVFKQEYWSIYWRPFKSRWKWCWFRGIQQNAWYKISNIC